MIDSHLHFWDPRQLEYFWLTSDQPDALRQAHLPAMLEAQMRLSGVTQGVYVQASHDPRENLWALELAREYPWIAAVVGWLDLTDAALEAQLQLPLRDPRFRGVRHLTHAIADPEWLLRPDVQRGFAVLEAHGLSVDLVLEPQQLQIAARVVAAFPNLQFILDHLGNPPFDERQERWTDDLRRLAQLPNLSAKVSGLLTRLPPGLPTEQASESLRLTVALAFEEFGAQRLMYGSDHPVSAVKTPYTATLETIRAALPALEADAFWAGTAQRVYRLPSGGA